MAKDKRKGGYVYRNVSIVIPEKQENEDTITPNQLQYIKKLAPDFSPSVGLENLGKWQASDVIDQIKQCREDLEYDIASRPKRKFVRKLFWLIVIIIILYFIIKSAG